MTYPMAIAAPIMTANAITLSGKSSIPASPGTKPSRFTSTVVEFVPYNPWLVTDTSAVPWDPK